MECAREAPSTPVPSISILGAFKWVPRERGEDAALQAVALMQQGNVVDLDVAHATRAAKLGLEHKLPLADSVILATARAYDAVLWTQDAEFETVEGMKYQMRPRAEQLLLGSREAGALPISWCSGTFVRGSEERLLGVSDSPA